MKKYAFNTSTYNLRTVVEEYLGNADLENLHVTDKFKGELTSAKGDYGDQKQALHRKFYNQMDSDTRFIVTYKKLIKEIIQPIFKEEIYYQKFPTFRIHQPDNICVFKWHRDMDFGHSEHETNVYLPITKAYGSNTIWAESKQDKKDYAPMEADYGQLIVWQGARLEHGNKANETGQPRVSFDFRVLKKKHYDESRVNKSLTRNVSFSLNNYFTSLDY